MDPFRFVLIGLSCLLVEALAVPTLLEGVRNGIGGKKSLESEPNLDGRIVGGLETDIRNHPYQVSLQMKGIHICGGAIIDTNIVITAAHCLADVSNPSTYSVRVGSSFHSHGGQQIKVRRIVRHEQYSMITQNNDIALLLLDSKIVYSPYSSPVQLAQPADILPSTLFVSGWGLTSEDGQVSPILRYVDVDLLSRQSCKQSYDNIIPITATMFCAGHLNGGKDSCQGDSGGPLVSIQSGQFKLAGIVSWGIGCAQSGYPGVYTKIAALRPWIDSHVSFLRSLR